MVQVKLSKMFVSGTFKGYALTVDGKLLSNQKSTIVDTKPHEIPRVTASFIVTNEMTVDAPDIYVKDYICKSEEKVKSEDKDYTTSYPQCLS